MVGWTCCVAKRSFIGIAITITCLRLPTITCALSQDKQLHFQDHRAFGTIVDEEGKPIAGAVLVPLVFDPWVSAEELSRIQTITDAEGKWEWNISKHPKIYVLQARKPGYLPNKIALGFENKQMTQLAIAYSVQGYVVDDQDREVEGAFISSIEHAEVDFSAPIRAISDNRGWFELRGITGLSTNLIAILPSGEAGYKGNVTSWSKELPTIELRKPVPVEFNVINKDNEPIDGADIALDSWQESKSIQWVSKTDKQGKVVWTAAPMGLCSFSIKRTGFHDAKIRFDVIGPCSRTIVLTPSTELTIRVVDSETDTPIDRFVVKYSSDDSWLKAIRDEDFGEKFVPWNSVSPIPRNAFIGSGGRFARESLPDLDTMDVEIFAIGYESLRIKVTKDIHQETLQELRLKRPFPERKGSSKVLNPDGQIAVVANVIFLSQGIIPIENDLDLLAASLSWPYHLLQRTDSNGAFRLIARASHDFVAAWNDQGSYVGLVEDLADGGSIKLEAYGSASIRLPAELLNKRFSQFAIQQDFKGRRAFSKVQFHVELEPQRLGEETADTFVSARVPSGTVQLVQRWLIPNTNRFETKKHRSIDIVPMKNYGSD